MMLQSKVRGPIALLATMMLAVIPVWSQEEAGEDEGRARHKVSLAYDGWIMQPSGLDYTPATVSDPTVSVANQAVQTNFGTNRNDRLILGFQLPQNMGRVKLGYQAVGFNTRQEDYRPGDYVFGESLAFGVPASYPGAAGVNDDSFADGYLYTTATTLREYVLAYERDAFRTQRVEGRWSIGWRNTRHRRNQEATYYAILSPLPPLLPPTANCPGAGQVIPGDSVVLDCPLAPDPDTASVGSTYDGRGLMARLEVDIQLWRDKVYLETGAAYTVERGKLDADFVGTNQYYVCTATSIDPATGEGCVEGRIVTYPFDEINQLIPVPGGDPIRVSDSVSQLAFSAGTATQSQSASSDILDLNIGVRWRVLNWFEITGGFRSSRYGDVGLDLIPQNVSLSVSGAVGIPDVKIKKTSVTYEGFFVGFRFSFF